MKVVIDRFEGKYAVCEKTDRTMINVEKSKIPRESKEGDVLIMEGNKNYIDVEETKRLSTEIEESTKNLWE